MMNDNYSLFSFAVFYFEDIAKFKNTIKSIFHKDFMEKKAELFSQEAFHVEHYYNPKGATQSDVFSFWKIKSNPDKIFFSSNSLDGRFTLCNVLHMQLKCDFLLCTLSNENLGSFQQYVFHYASEKNERHITVYQDPQWTFYECGTPLPIEDMSLYKKRLIKNRLNNAIIKQYLCKMGIVFERINDNIIESYTCIRRFT